MDGGAHWRSRLSSRSGVPHQGWPAARASTGRTFGRYCATYYALFRSLLYVNWSRKLAQQTQNYWFSGLLLKRPNYVLMEIYPFLKATCKCRTNLVYLVISRSQAFGFSKANLGSWSIEGRVAAHCKRVNRRTLMSSVLLVYCANSDTFGYVSGMTTRVTVLPASYWSCLVARVPQSFEYIVSDHSQHLFVCIRYTPPSQYTWL